jgi:hypothetical protein
MAKKQEVPSYEQAVESLKQRGFDVLEAPATPGRVFLKKYNCSAAIEKDPNAKTDIGEPAVKIFVKPGYLIGAEIARLVDKGFQKFLKTTRNEIPATADHLKALHQFTEELREATGATSLYNESLGSVSDSYQYDRVKDRDEPEASRPKRPWERVKAKLQGSKKPA